MPILELPSMAIPTQASLYRSSITALKPMIGLLIPVFLPVVLYLSVLVLIVLSRILSVNATIFLLICPPLCVIVMLLSVLVVSTVVPPIGRMSRLRLPILIAVWMLLLVILMILPICRLAGSSAGSIIIPMPFMNSVLRSQLMKMEFIPFLAIMVNGVSVLFMIKEVL